MKGNQEKETRKAKRNGPRRKGKDERGKVDEYENRDVGYGCSVECRLDGG
jgi:hypothetical protein